MAETGLFEWTIADNRLSVSALYRTLLGFSPNDVITQDLLLSRIYPDDHAQFAANHARLLQEGGRVEAEFRVTRPDGEIRWLLTRAELTRDPVGAPLKVTGVMSDITNKKLSEQSLRRSEERWRRLFEQIYEGFIFAEAVRDSTGAIVDFRLESLNSAFENHTGIPIASAVGRTTREVVPGFPENLIANGAHVIETGEPVQREVELPELGWFEIRAHRSEPEHLAVLFTNISERKRAEEANALVAAVVASSNDAVFSADPSHRIRTWNDAAMRLYGYTEAEAVGQPLTLIAPGHLVGDIEALSERVLRGERVRLETVRRRKDGTLVDVSISGSPMYSRDGRVIGISAVHTDISARKRAEQALRESEAQFRFLANSMPQLVWTATSDGTVDYYNDRIHEYDVRSEHPSDWQSFIHPEDLAGTLAAWRHANDTGTTYEFEHRLKSRDGNYHWHLSRAIPVRDASSAIIKWYGTATDVDAARRDTEALRETETWLQLAQEVGNIGAWQAFPDLGISRWSTHFFRMLGCDPAVTKPSYDEFLARVHPDDRAAAIAARLSGETVEFRIVRPDGSIRWFMRRAQMIPGTGPRRMVGVNVDITERKQREEHLRFITRELSHRSKNLLAVIQAMARQTARQTENFEEFEDKFSGRIQALARSHDLLVQGDWRGASLNGLIAAQLAPFMDVSTPRVVMNGPEVMLTAELAQSIGLALHELATNASKYGALSGPLGNVTVEWTLEPPETQPRRFYLVWRERGGPTVKPPARKGFGHVVLEHMAATAIGATLALEFPPEGVCWSLMIPDFDQATRVAHVGRP